MKKLKSPTQAKLTPLSVFIYNFGLKAAGWDMGDRIAMPKADFYIDARGLPDGAMNAPGVSGDDPIQQEWLKAEMAKQGIHLSTYVRLALDAIYAIPHRRRQMTDPYTKPFIIACFCAYGLNRSRGLKNLLAPELQAQLNELMIDREAFVKTLWGIPGLQVRAKS